MPDVFCSVNTCRYNEHGQLCNASEIVVQSDREGSQGSVRDPKSLKPTPCSSIDETCCQTFQKS